MFHVPDRATHPGGRPNGLSEAIALGPIRDLWVPGFSLRGTPRVDRMATRKLVFDRMVQDI